MNYVLHLMVYFDIYLILALSLNLVVGYCGLLSLAHAGFYAVGGYSYALLSLKGGWGFVPASLAGAGIAAVLSLALSLSAWRLRGDFFVLGSLAVQTFIFSGLYNWSSADAPLGSLRNLTNGPLGIPNIPHASIVGLEITTIAGFAVFATGTAALCALILRRLFSSPWGRLLLAMRDDELAARGLGKDTRLAKVQALAISCGFAAVAGCLYAAHIRYLNPSSASLDESILVLAMVLVGGLGNFRGPFIGAGVLLLLPEFLRLLDFPDSQAANLRLLIYGVLLVLMMHFRPQGIAGKYRMQ